SLFGRERAGVRGAPSFCGKKAGERVLPSHTPGSARAGAAAFAGDCRLRRPCRAGWGAACAATRPPSQLRGIAEGSTPFVQFLGFPSVKYRYTKSPDNRRRLRLRGTRLGEKLLA